MNFHLIPAAERAAEGGAPRCFSWAAEDGAACCFSWAAEDGAAWCRSGRPTAASRARWPAVE